jgi:hypothetical protein
MPDQQPKNRPKQRRTKKLEVPVEPSTLDDAVLKARQTLPAGSPSSGAMKRVRAVMRALLKGWISGQIELDESEIDEEQTRAQKRKKQKP